MKVTAPSYYASFKCKADQCLHNCCIGWEIFVDDETFEFYKNSKTAFSKKICENINCSPDGAQFMVDENKKCPFLLDDGLCEIIRKEGEDWLCQICRDHPRFRNYFSDRVEIGLGMCCEQATWIILSSCDNTIKTITDDGIEAVCNKKEEDFFKRREKILGILHTGKITFSDFVKMVEEEYPHAGLYGTPIFWNSFLSSLECMDKSWEKHIDALVSESDSGFDFCPLSDNLLKNLFEYFLYRHLPKIFDGYSYDTCISFCLVSTALICLMFKNSGSDNIEDFMEISRMFSCEIEYSDENTYAIFDILDEII